MKTRWKIGLVALLGSVGLCLGGGAWYWQSRGAKEDTGFETAEVDRGDITARVTASGVVSAVVTVQVGSQVSGRIQELLVDFNDPVTKGQVLARLDPQLLAARLDQARASTQAAQGDLVRARAQAEDADRQASRAEALAGRQLIAQADADTLRSTARAMAAAVEASKGQLAQARAAEHQAEVDVEYATILSPIDGVVISRNVDVGQTVAASLSAPTLFVLAQDLSQMKVDTSVAEADIGKLKPGMEAQFTVDAWPTDKFVGTIRQVRNAATVVQNVVTYDAVIDVANPEGKLRPGMTANVSFDWDTRTDVLRVPNAALRFRAPKSFGSDGGKKNGKDARTVWRLTNGQPERLTIKIGLTDGSQTELIGEELAAGDKLLTYAPDPAAGKTGGNAFSRGH